MVATSKKQKSKLRAQQLPSRSASRQRSPSPYRAGTPFGFWPDWNVDQQQEWVERNIITWGNKTDEEKATWYLQKDEEERLLAIERESAPCGAFDSTHAIEYGYAAFQKGEVDTVSVMVHHVIKEVNCGEPVVVHEVEIKKGKPLEVYEERLHRTEWEIIMEAM
jgi:hypothetical protein